MAAKKSTAARTFASPRLCFKSAAKAIEFYEKAFGAKESWRFENEGGVGHAEVMFGDSVVMLCEEWQEGGRSSAETLGKSPVSMTIQVPDVDAFAAHAVAAGARLVGEITDQFYGHRDATLTDPFGYTWNIYTVKEEMSIEEMHRRFKAMMESPKKP
jgi:PhnB protein